MEKEDLKNFFRYAISRLDGAWFRFVEKKYGIDATYEIDTKVMEDWYMRMARYAKKMLKLEDFSLNTYFDTYYKCSEALSELFAGEGDTEFIDNKIISRTTHCSQWEEIQKAGVTDYAKAGKMCSDAHIAVHKGLLKGIFPDQEFKITLPKRIPAGDDCCEIIIELK